MEGLGFDLLSCFVVSLLELFLLILYPLLTLPLHLLPQPRLLNLQLPSHLPLDTLNFFTPPRLQLQLRQPKQPLFLPSKQGQILRRVNPQDLPHLSKLMLELLGFLLQFFLVLEF